MRLRRDGAQGQCLAAGIGADGNAVADGRTDELLAGRDPHEVFDSGDLFRDLKKALVERILDAEMDAHLEGKQARGESNRRNGHNRKRVLSGDRRPVASALKEIYGAATVGQAEAALEVFESGEWNEKYPAVAKSWRTNWERVIPFLAFSENVRKAVYTTNQIESPDSSLRRAVRRRGHFPGDDAARKLLYLALRDIAARWKGPPAYWPEASREFAIQFGERFRILD